MDKSERRLHQPKGCPDGIPPPPLHPSDVRFGPMMPLFLLGAVLAILGRINTDGRRTRKTALAPSDERRGAIRRPRAATSTPERSDASVGRHERA